MKASLFKIRIAACAALVASASMASAQVVLNLDGEIVPIESSLAEIIYIPAQSRLVINTQWDDLRCVLNPDGPEVPLPEPQPGDFVLALDQRPGDLMGEYVIESDGSISQLLGALSGDPVQLEIVTSAARVNNCTAGGDPQCAVLVCASGGTPIFSDSLEVPPPPQIDLSVNGLGSSAVVAGSAPNNVATQIAVQNNSAIAASNVVVNLAQSIPAGAIAGSVSTTAGSYNPSNGEWTLPNIAASSNATATLLFTAESSVANGSDVCVTGTVLSADQELINIQDDSDQHCASIEREVDLVLDVTSPASSASPGEAVAYFVSVDNNGPSDASNVVVDLTDQIPVDVSRSAIFQSTGTLDSSNWMSGQGATWTLATIPAGSTATRTLNLTYTVGSSVVDGSMMQVNASVTANETRINQDNDNASGTTQFSNP